MIVVDASAAVLGLLNVGDARQTMRSEALATPHLADTEVARTMRAHVRRQSMASEAARAALSTWAALGIRRFGVTSLLGRMWELRDTVSAYDAAYVALAETLQVPLLTADARLASAKGPSCPFLVVRS